MNSPPIPHDALRLSVAPMMDWTDTHCRVFHRLLAPNARLYTEMVHAQAVIHGDRDRLLGFDTVEHPVAVQLGGSEPAHLAQAARIAQDLGYDEVNLNVGCPSDRVQAGRFGACLMKEPALVAECVAAMIDVVDIPVTVKCRLGVDEQEDYDLFLAFIDTVAATRCNTFFVHARKAWLQGLSPKENREIPPLRYEIAAQLKQDFPDLEIILNGGIKTLEECEQHLQTFDGVMLGREAYHNPYLLAQVDSRLFGAADAGITRMDALLALKPYVEQHLREGGTLHHVSRHVLGLAQGFPGARRFRQLLSVDIHKVQDPLALLDQAAELLRGH